MAKFEVCISTEIDGANVPVEAEQFGIDEGVLAFFDGNLPAAREKTRAVFAAGKWVYFERLDE